MLFVDVRQVLFPSQTLLLAVDLNVLGIQIVSKDLSVRTKDVLKSQILAIQHHVDLELNVPSQDQAMLYVDVRQVLYPSLTP